MSVTDWEKSDRNGQKNSLCPNVHQSRISRRLLKTESTPTLDELENGIRRVIGEADLGIRKLVIVNFGQRIQIVYVWHFGGYCL